MRAEFNSNEQLVITSVGVAEKMALLFWKEKTFPDGKFPASDLILSHEVPEVKAVAADEEKPLYCTFCAKRRDEVTMLIAGPYVNICNECVGICNQIISGKR